MPGADLGDPIAPATRSDVLMPRGLATAGIKDPSKNPGPGLKPKRIVPLPDPVPLAIKSPVIVIRKSDLNKGAPAAAKGGTGGSGAARKGLSDDKQRALPAGKSGARADAQPDKDTAGVDDVELINQCVTDDAPRASVVQV